MRILFIADVVGSPGRKAARALLRRVRKSVAADAVVLNAENSAGGFGMTPSTVGELRELGVDVITSGNHVWDKKEVLSLLESDGTVLRPANFPPGAAGGGVAVVEIQGVRLGVLNLQGRVFMQPIDDPFRAADSLIEGLSGRADVVVVDFHAEATSEKQSLGRYLDGRVAAVVGTHTHVQTADERILPGGTAYMTDLGMTGSQAGIIGMKTEPSLHRLLRQTRGERLSPADGELYLQGAVVQTDPESGLAQSIERISVSYDEALDSGKSKG